MKAQKSSLFSSLQKFLGNREHYNRQTRSARDLSAFSAFGTLGSQLRQGLQGRAYEFDQMQQDVANEQRGAIWLIGRCQPALLATRQALHQQRGEPSTHCENPRYDGLFTCFSLPDEEASAGKQAMHFANDIYASEIFTGKIFTGEIFTGEIEEIEMTSSDSNQRFNASTQPSWQTEEYLESASRADCLLYVCTVQDGWLPADSRWCARLRNLGATLVPIFLTNDENKDDLAQALEAVRLRLGIRPFVVAMPSTPQDAGGETPIAPDMALPEAVIALLDHLLALRPRLAIPLAQEVPGYRAHILRRIVRQGALFTALFGAEPVPLIDLPLQIAVSWKMALQIASIYGRPGLDYRSREMMGTLVSNLAARAVCQQALKLTPLVGWALSAAISGGSAWLLGQSLIRFYERGFYKQDSYKQSRWADFQLAKLWQVESPSLDSLLASLSRWDRSWLRRAKANAAPATSTTGSLYPDEALQIIPLVDEEEATDEEKLSR